MSNGVTGNEGIIIIYMNLVLIRHSQTNIDFKCSNSFWQLLGQEIERVQKLGIKVFIYEH